MKFKKIYTRIVVISSLLFGFSACDDDEFNKIKGSLGNESSILTLNERLETTSELSAFSDVTTSIIVDENSNETLAQLLDRYQSAEDNGITLQYTVLAPNNS